MSPRSVVRGALIVLVGGVLAVACNSSDGQSGGNGSGNDDDGGTGNGGGGNSNGDGDGGDPSHPFKLPDGGPGMIPSSCVDVSVKGEKLPTDLYLMMDTSASMAEATKAGGPTKWDAVRAAMESFFNEPLSSGIGIGLQYFPHVFPDAPKECMTEDACGAYGPCWGLRACAGLGYISRCLADKDCDAGHPCQPMGYCYSTHEFCVPLGDPCGMGDTCKLPIKGDCLGRDSCATSDYSTPAVPVGTLPEAAAGLVASLKGHTPDGYTPTSAALTGALEYARARAMANMDRKQGVVLATDGLPTTCDKKDIKQVADIAAAAVAQSPPIKTFVVGVFTPEEAVDAQANLDQLARAGGTTSAHIVNTNQDVAKSFLDALDDIRSSAVGCEIKMPTTSPKGKIDYGNVNVRFTSGSGQELTIGYAGSADRCHATFGGWYYDVDPKVGTPTKILTCPVTCELLKNDPKGRIDILIGCATIYVE